MKMDWNQVHNITSKYQNAFTSSHQMCVASLDVSGPVLNLPLIFLWHTDNMTTFADTKSRLLIFFCVQDIQARQGGLPLYPSPPDPRHQAPQGAL